MVYGLQEQVFASEEKMGIGKFLQSSSLMGQASYSLGVVDI